MHNAPTPHLTLLHDIYEEILAELSQSFFVPNDIKYIAANTAADSYIEVLNKEPDTEDKFNGLAATIGFLKAKQFEIEQAT